LRKHFDAIVFPDASPESMESGLPSGSMPPEFTGGLDATGADALRDFASAGGTLIFLNRASEYAIRHLGVAARNLVHGAECAARPAPSAGGRFARGLGHLVGAKPRLGHRVKLSAPVRYPDAHLLASGWLLGEKYLAGKAALVDAPLGSGHVILFGMRPQYRAQSCQTFKLFFNALLY